MSAIAIGVSVSGRFASHQVATFALPIGINPKRPVRIRHFRTFNQRSRLTANSHPTPTTAMNRTAIAAIIASLSGCCSTSARTMIAAENRTRTRLSHVERHAIALPSPSAWAGQSQTSACHHLRPFRTSRLGGKRTFVSQLFEGSWC